MFEKAHLGLAFASRMDSHTLALHTVWYLGVHGHSRWPDGSAAELRATVRSVTGGWESGACLEGALSS